MTFKSLNNLLKVIENQPQWSEYRRYCRVCQCWDKIIEPKFARHTRPLYIHRNILAVATSSAVWAQNLALKRYSLLKKLNSQLSCDQLSDLHFSSAQWYSSPPLTTTTTPQSSHPSDLNFTNPVCDDPQISPPKTPEEAFQRWLKVVEKNSQFLELCPQCHCPTPPGELERWSICINCAAQTRFN
ncbi:MAG TPA: DUF721 domain-containing protein [Cyanothece sp. UBA12306]|nr:DUF721 domain-containing protein [Cyanothece sp. UBA12306]